MRHDHDQRAGRRIRYARQYYQGDQEAHVLSVDDFGNDTTERIHPPVSQVVRTMKAEAEAVARYAKQQQEQIVRLATREGISFDEAAARIRGRQPDSVLKYAWAGTGPGGTAKARYAKLCQQAVSLATREGIGYDEALAQLQAEDNSPIDCGIPAA